MRNFEVGNIYLVGFLFWSIHINFYKIYHLQYYNKVNEWVIIINLLKRVCNL